MSQGEDGDSADEDDFVGQVFEGLDTGPLEAVTPLKTEFAPWHHPVKQVVRTEQWAVLVRKLINDTGPPPDGVLRYLTLPGNDLMDVRVIAQACGGSTTVRYLGFNTSEAEAGIAPWSEAQAAIQQEGLADAQSQIVHDRIEDIASKGSNAASTLEQQLHFDVVNLDACSHLAYVHEGRTTSLFDALTRIVAHQLTSKRPWLLFITTRVAAELIGDAPKGEFDAALSDNLQADGEFGVQLREAIGLSSGDIKPQLDAAWKENGANLLKLYSISLGKHILRHIYAQPNLSAKVELVSTYCYRVNPDSTDMVALAYRITSQFNVFEPGAEIAVALPEPKIALKIVHRSRRLFDVDNALDKDAGWRKEAVEETEKLLAVSNYDVTAYRKWLAEHRIRPIVL